MREVFLWVRDDYRNAPFAELMVRTINSEQVKPLSHKALDDLSAASLHTHYYTHIAKFGQLGIHTYLRIMADFPASMRERLTPKLETRPRGRVVRCCRMIGRGGSAVHYQGNRRD